MAVIGVLFDIDALGGGFYGKTAYGIVFDAVGRNGLRKVRLYDGDVTLPGQDDARLYCIAIEAEDETLIRRIKDALNASTREGLRAPPQRFLRSPASIGTQPLVFAGTIDAAGVLSGCDTPWIVESWQGPVKATYDAILKTVGPNKFAVMKEVRVLLPNLGLAETRTLVERAPVALKVNLRRDEAAEIAQKLEHLGAEVEIR